MNGEFSMGLIIINQMLIFWKMDILLKNWWIYIFFKFVLQVAKKKGCLYLPTTYISFYFECLVLNFVYFFQKFLKV